MISPVTATWSGDYVALTFRPFSLGGVLYTGYGPAGIAKERDALAKRYHDAIIAAINEKFHGAKEC